MESLDLESGDNGSSLPHRLRTALSKATLKTNPSKWTLGTAASDMRTPLESVEVDFDHPYDPENPRDWSDARKYGILAILSFNTFMTPLASSMFAPGVPQLIKEFGSTSSLLSSFVVSVYLIGFCAGPLLVAPLSELYGRLYISHVSNVLFLIFAVACALSTDLNMLIVFRLFLGLSGCTPLTVGGGTIADTIPQDKRGMALSIWALGPLMGPALGPIIGGFLSQAMGWRWVFWLLSMMAGATTLLYLLFVRETYAPVVLARKTRRLQKLRKNPNLRPKLGSTLSRGAVFRKAIIRPLKMLFCSPIVASMSVIIGINYSYLYLLFTTFTFVFEGQYGFGPSTAGLTYLGIGVGMLVALFVVGRFSDHILKRMAGDGERKPEYRLPLMIPAVFFTPIGLLWYGWSAQYHVHWIVPIIGTAFVGIGQVGMTIPVQTYFIDAFTLYAASATAALTVLRSLLGAIVPLAGQPLYDRLGLGWGNTLLACISLLMIAIPPVLIRYGERIRTKYQVDL